MSTTKRSLKEEIDIKLIDNYSVATKLLELSELMTHALSRSLRVLNSLGVNLEESVTGANQSITSQIRNDGSRGCSGGDQNPSGNEIGQMLRAIMRKLRIGSQPELYDALSLLWKMLDGEEASETRSRNTEKEKVGEKDNWHIPKSLTYLNSDGNQQKMTHGKILWYVR